MLAGYDNGYNLNQRFKVHLQQFGVYAESQVPKLISREIIFAEFQRVWSQSTNVTLDGRTDRQLIMAIPRYATLRFAR